MIFKSLPYFLGESVKSVLRNGWMSIASIAVVAVTLMMLGIFMILNMNVGWVTAEIQDQVEIVAYVDLDATPQQVETLRKELISISEVEKVTHVSPAEAMERLKSRLGERAEYLVGYEDEDSNPLRESFEVKTIIPEDVYYVAAQIESLPSIDYVDYGEGIVENLFQITNFVRYIALIFMLAMGVTALFLISNTIKLAVYSRREEIMIMKYVGATDWFIRWPFLIEGILLGLGGALIPVILLSYFYGILISWVSGQTVFFNFVSATQITPDLFKILLPLGVFIGGLGSIMAARKFLKV